MANELIVDFPERSDNYYMRPRDREEGNNNHGNGGGGRGRGRSPLPPAASRGRNHSYDYHHGRRGGHLEITWDKRRKKMANELIVDFPERPDNYYMRPRDREENNNHGNDGHGSGGGGGRGRGRSSPHPAASRGRSSRSYDFHGRRSHRHGQIEMMSNVKTKRRSDRYHHRSRSKSCDHNYYSSRDDRSHSHRFSCSCHPPLTLHTRSVHFAETSLLHIVLKVREQILDGVFIDDLGKDDADTSEESSSSRIVCTMGIESRLTPARVNEVKTCRARCVLAVLKQQERQQTMMDLSSSPTSARLS
jgi:hypothetical protein